MGTLKKRTISFTLALTMLMTMLMPLTVLGETPTTYAINCVAHNITDGTAVGTVYIETDIDSYEGSAAFGEATENTSVTINAVANLGYEFVGWRKNVPSSPEATISTTPNYTFNATEGVWLYAIFQKIPETWTVTISGLYVCGADYNYKEEQKVEKGQAMTPVVFTANEGYYFPEDLEVQGADYGITVTRDSYTQVTISGTPTNYVNVGFAAKAKKKEEIPNQLYFEATGADTGNLCNLENGVTYSVSGAATAEFTATESMYALTNVTKGSLNVVRKTRNLNTGFDSDAYAYTVGKQETLPNCYGTNCTDANNNNGQIRNVSIEMEYQKEGDSIWTAGTGDHVTGLTPGTYFVRYKANSINLAGNSQTINIAEYNVPALAGDVEISGTAKYGEVLTATVTDSNNTGEFSYQWKRNNTSISGANSETYTIGAEDVGSHISVIVTSNVESGSISSAATEIVAKADGPIAPSGLSGIAPTTYGGNDGKILGTSTAMEYSTDESFVDANVCPDDETIGLMAGTYYVRYKETITHEAGEYITIVIPKEIKSVTATINGIEAGVTADSTTVTTDDTTYTVSIIGWYDCDNVFLYASAPVLQPSDTFEGGKTYTVGVKFTPVGSDTLSSSLDVSINEKDGKIGGWESGSRNFYVTITVPKKYPVTFDANGGTGTVEPFMVEENKKITLDDCVFTAPQGHKFKAWAIGSISGEQKQPGEEITITAETNIYAIWEENCYPKTIKLTTTTYTYDGKVKKPSVEAVDSNGEKIALEYYTISYPSGCKNVGTYTVKVTFKKKYEGTAELTYIINPAKTSVKKLVSGKKSLKVTVKKKSTQVTGYEIQYSTSKKFTKSTTKTKIIKKYKTTSATLKKLKAKKKYFVRVRTYKTVNGKKYYSEWSAIKSKKTKK